MSTDSDASSEGEMEKINVRVPQSLLAHVNEVWEERGYANKSEFIRDALQDAVNPPTQLSHEIPVAASVFRSIRDNSYLGGLTVTVVVVSI